VKPSGDQTAVLKHDLEEERRIRRALVDSSIRLNSTFNLSELLQEIIQTAADLVAAEAGSLLIYDEASQELSFEVAAGQTKRNVTTLRIPASSGIAGWVLKNDKPAITDQVRKDPRFSDAIDRTLGFETESLLAVPLKARDRMIGVVELVNKKGKKKFSERDLDVACAFAAQAAVAIDNAHLYGKLADAVLQSRMTYRL
jgi:GAF domain-containing protein